MAALPSGPAPGRPSALTSAPAGAAGSVRGGLESAGLTLALAAGLLLAAGLPVAGAPWGGLGVALGVLLVGCAAVLLPALVVRRLALGAVAAFVLVAGGLAALLPASRGWPLALTVGAAVLLLPAAALLSLRAETLRARLRQQRSELGELRLALEQTQERLRLLGSDDPLTGLTNRRHMMAVLQAERARHLRSRQPLALVLIDLDLFRRINAAYGESAGDTVLKRVAQAGRSTLRASDLMGRWGGEEFLLMLPETTPDAAAACVERLRAALARMRFDDVAPRLPVQFSAGIAVLQGTASLEVALEAAQAALRRAKAEGGNRAEWAEWPQPAAPVPA